MSGLGEMRTIPVGDKVGASSPAVDTLALRLGTVVEGEDGKAYRFVRLNLAAGVAAVEMEDSARAFKYSDAAARGTFDVEPVDGLTDRVCGVSVVGQEVLADNDLFWLQIDGEFEAELGDGTAWSAGDYIRASADTDLGKFEEAATSGTTWAEGQTFAIAVDAAASDGDIATAVIVKRLM